MVNMELKSIKDKYGEKMMQICRELFPTLLDNNNLLFKILSDNFAYSKYLYEDIINNNLVNEFICFIYSNVNYIHELKTTTKTPFELLALKGYTLYECKSKEDINKFKKYYAKGEELCTFDSNKLSNYHIFFAVKNNALELNRNAFLHPLREDEYGTSVISIQFRRNSIYNAVSIKNRYNHTVPNPDATFYNNLDNIIPGLTKSFELTYNLNISNIKEISLNIPNYLRASNGIYYRYNYKIGNTYYCPNNIIITNNNVIDSYCHSEKYLLIDYFLFDLENKTITLYDNTIDDGFIKSIKDIVKIDIYRDKLTNNKYIYITLKENIITLFVNKYNEIYYYYDAYSISIPNNFLLYTKKITEISLPNVKNIGNNFLLSNKNLEKIFIPNINNIGTYFLFSNKVLTKKRLTKKIT